jgi:hypothetical protein
MKGFAKSAALFVAVGLLLYAGIYYAAEKLLYRTGDTNPFFKIASTDTRQIDWVILGASHAMPLDFHDFNSAMENATGKRIVNLAAPGAGPLYNRFVLDQFLSKHQAANVLYVADSFAFYGQEWNEDRFADAKLLSRTPFDPNLARRFFTYVVQEGVDARALIDYATGFSKINNRDRFKKDIWEGETTFDRVYRSSATATAKRIAYLYPKGAPNPATTARYLAVLDGLITTAQENGASVTVLKLPLPAMFREKLPSEAEFDQKLAAHLSAQGVPLHDFSSAMDEPRFYLDTDHLNRAGATEFLERHLKTILTGNRLNARDGS